jgi:hypothetical protein
MNCDDAASVQATCSELARRPRQGPPPFNFSRPITKRTVTDDVAHFEKMLVSLAQEGDRETLRRFALDCARAAMEDSAAPPLWTESIGLLEERVAGSLSEGTFRHRAAAIECRFPLLTILGGLRNGDARAATALTVMAALRTSAVEAALDAARGERLHARLAAPCINAASATQGIEGRPGEHGLEPARAALHCLHRQVLRLGKQP